MIRTYSLVFLAAAMALSVQVPAIAQDVPNCSSGVPQNYASKEDAIAAARKSFVEGAELYKKGTAEDYREAIKKFQQAAAAYEFGSDKRSEAEAITRAGLANSDLGQNDQALGCYKRALTTRRIVRDRSGEAATLNSIASVYSDRGWKQTALEYFYQALAIFRQLGDRSGEAITLNNIGGIYDDIGSRKKALTYYQSALTIRREVKDRRGEARTLNDIGLLYSAMGQNRKALEFYDQALPIWREVLDRSGEATTLSNIGLAYDYLGEEQKALDYYNQVVPIDHVTGDLEGEATTLDNIGDIYDVLGQRQEALDFHNQALPIWRHIGNPAGEAGTLTSIGRTYGDLGQQQEALKYYSQALPLRQQASDRPGEATTLNDMGRAYYALGQKQEAIKYYAQALLIRQKVWDRIGEGVTLNNIGSVLADLGQYQQALMDYNRALSIEREVEDREHEAETLGNLMRLFKTSEPALAIIFGKQSVNVLQGLRKDISGLRKELQQGFVKSKEDTYRQLAELMISNGRLWEAQQVLDLLKDEEYFEFIQRGEPVARTGQMPFVPADAETLVNMDKERWALAAKAELSPDEKNRKDYLDDQLKAAKKAARQLFDQMSRVRRPQGPSNGSKAAEYIEPTGLQKDLRHLPGTIALYTLTGKDSFHALLITSEVMKRWDYKIAATDLRSKVFKFREALRNPNSDPLPLARELYGIIIGDLDRELAAVKATTILWSLDDVLRYLPMAALNDGHVYLAERFRNVVYSNASSRVGGTFNNWHALGAGVSQPHYDLRPLDSVPGELHAIIHDDSDPKANGVLPGKILLDPTFTAAAFREALHQKYAVVHIASHFVFNPGIDDSSYLLLGDGKLTLAELRKNDDYTFDNVELLTLSACDTAAGSKGDGREIDGLGYLAEEDKGADAVVSTLWAVDDESTGEFMQRFYRELSGTTGMTKAGALQAAELALLHGEVKRQGESRASFTHPYYWAPFILIGNGN